jgi:The Golgi pH Regulator (GPHR) Family N-terminal
VRSGRAVGIIGLLIVAILSGRGSASTPIKVVDTAADETTPAIAPGWLAWARDTGKKYEALVRPTGGTARTIPSHFDAFPGSVILGGPHADQVVFWEFARRGNGRIRFYDLVTRDVHAAPKGVNTTKSEELASVSGDYLLFARGPAGAGNDTRVILYRFSTRRFRTIASSTEPVFTADDVTGDFAVYTRCGSTTCNVIRYRISTGRRVVMPAAPRGRANYFGAVLGNGTVYYAQGSFSRCGGAFGIERRRAGHVTAIATLANGADASGLDVARIGDRPVVVFQRIVCATGKGGIYRVAG